MSYAEDQFRSELLRNLRDISESLKIISGRKEKEHIHEEEPKKSYAAQYFARSTPDK